MEKKMKKTFILVIILLVVIFLLHLLSSSASAKDERIVKTGGFVKDFVVEGNYAFVISDINFTDKSEFCVVDLAKASKISQLIIDGRASLIACENSVCCAITEMDNGNFLYVINTKNPNKPRLAQKTSLDFERVNDIEISESSVFVLGYSGGIGCLKVLDAIGTREFCILMDTFNCISVCGRYVFIGGKYDDVATIEVYDMQTGNNWPMNVGFDMGLHIEDVMEIESFDDSIILIGEKNGKTSLLVFSRGWNNPPEFRTGYYVPDARMGKVKRDEDIIYTSSAVDGGGGYIDYFRLDVTGMGINKMERVKTIFTESMPNSFGINGEHLVYSSLDEIFIIDKS